MGYLAGSEELVGYRVRIDAREAFTVVGYTLIVPPQQEHLLIPRFWDEVIGDGRLETLRSTCPTPPWVLGLGSWDPECPKHGQRYTICIEEAPDCDLAALERQQALYREQIGASEWMCFETTQVEFEQRFWKDNPYQMMKRLGYRFNARDPGTGLHFDAYPPNFREDTDRMEFWITVRGRQPLPPR